MATIEVLMGDDKEQIKGTYTLLGPNSIVWHPSKREWVNAWADTNKDGWAPIGEFNEVSLEDAQFLDDLSYKPMAQVQILANVSENAAFNRNYFLDEENDLGIILNYATVVINEKRCIGYGFPEVMSADDLKSKVTLDELVIKRDQAKAMANPAIVEYVGAVKALITLGELSSLGMFTLGIALYNLTGLDVTHSISCFGILGESFAQYASFRSGRAMDRKFNAMDKLKSIDTQIASYNPEILTGKAALDKLYQVYGNVSK
jgi:hypothetical protein